MKKRILSLALCALMIIASFVGCAEKSKEEVMNDIGAKTSEGAVTLTMYILAEDKVSAEQELLVENAVNDIVNSYKIKLDLKYFTEDEYYTTLEKNLAKMKEYYASKDKAKETETPVYTDDNGLPTTYYPPTEEFQVDLFYFSGYERYKKYEAAGYLGDFTSQLINNASPLKGGISSILYENVKTINGKYDMMPVNGEVGEYTYMLVNKSVLSSTQYKAEDIASLTSDECADLLSLVKGYYPDYVPLYSTEGVLSFENVKFFGSDAKGYASNDFSIIAGTYDSKWTYGKQNAYPAMGTLNASVDNGNGTVAAQIKTLKSYDFNGYYATEADADKPFAVGYIKGGLEVIDEYSDDYEVMVVEAPKLTTEAFYENAIAIAAKTSSMPSSSKILAELYTNEELINILAHGVEGENYVWTNSNVLDKNDQPYRVIQKQNKDDRYIYNIDPYKIGNTAEVYSTVDDDPARSERILAQNGDAKLDLLFGYSLYGQSAHISAMAKVAELSKPIYDKIVAAKNAEELDAALAELDTVAASEEVKAIFADGGVSAYYTKWLTNSKIIVTEEKK